MSPRPSPHGYAGINTRIGHSCSMLDVSEAACGPSSGHMPRFMAPGLVVCVSSYFGLSCVMRSCLPSRLDVDVEYVLVIEYCPNTTPGGSTGTCIVLVPADEDSDPIVTELSNAFREPRQYLSGKAGAKILTLRMLGSSLPSSSSSRTQLGNLSTISQAKRHPCSCAGCSAAKALMTEKPNPNTA